MAIKKKYLCMAVILCVTAFSTQSLFAVGEAPVTRKKSVPIPAGSKTNELCNADKRHRNQQPYLLCMSQEEESLFFTSIQFWEELFGRTIRFECPWDGHSNDPVQDEIGNAAIENKDEISSEEVGKGQLEEENQAECATQVFENMSNSIEITTDIFSAAETEMTNSVCPTITAEIEPLPTVTETAVSSAVEVMTVLTTTSVAPVSSATTVVSGLSEAIATSMSYTSTESEADWSESKASAALSPPIHPNAIIPETDPSGGTLVTVDEEREIISEEAQRETAKTMSSAELAPSPAVQAPKTGENENLLRAFSISFFTLSSVAYLLRTRRFRTKNEE